MAAKKPPLGSGERFEGIVKKVEAEGKSPEAAKAIAASAGRAAHGSKKMAAYAHEGKARNDKHEAGLHKHLAERERARGK